MATIQEAYQAACNAGFIKRNEFSEEAFGNMLQDDNNRRAYYDHVTKIDPTFYSKDYDTFSQNVLSALGKPNAKNSTNQPSNAPAPSQVQPTFQPAQGQPTFWQSIGAHDPYPQKTAEGVTQFEKEQQLQRESAATMPLSQQDKDRQAEIQRLQTEGIWGKPNGITMDIDKQTGLPTINQTKGDGMHLSIGATPSNQDEIDRLKAEQPAYITREIKTPQDLYTSVSEAWAANTPDGQKAKAELDKTAQDTYNNLLADMNRQIADLQQQVNNGTVTQQQAQQEAQRIADNTNAVYENEMQLAQDYFFRQMTDANADYLSQQARLLGQKATNQTISDINARIAPHIRQLETERQQAMQRASQSVQAQGGMYGAIGASMSANTTYKPEKDQELALYHQSQQFLADAAKISDAAQKGEGFWKGLGKSLGDIDTWDFGISQLTRSANLKDIVEKYERGEQLTDAEKGLMDSAVAYMSACAYNSDKINRRYKMGQTTGESIPFMLQFMVMPIGAIKDKVAKGVLGYGIEQFGGKAAQAAGKVAAKYGAKTAFKEAGTALLSNLAAAGVQTAAFGVPKIAEGAISRMTGDIQPTITEQGNIAYNGRRNQQSAASAVWNSAVDMYAENLSEMILTSLDPLKAYAGTAKLFSGLKNSQIAQVLGRLNEGVIGKVRDRVQFRNYLEEVGEEYVGNLIRWGLSTDVNNAEDAGLSADRQIDTWLGLAPTSIAFGAANIVEGGIDRFQSSRAAKRLREIMADGDKRRYLESLLKSRNSDDFSKNAHEVIKSVLRDKELNEDTKRLIMDGIYYTYQSQLAQEAEQARVQAEAERQTQPEQQPEQSAQQEIGQQTASAAESEANQEGEEHYQDADGNEVTFYRNADGSVSLRDENDNAAVDEHGNAVVLTQAEFDKYTQDTNLRRVDRELSADQWAERENELRQQYASEIRPNTHNDGNVYEVALASDGNKHGYIVGDGNVEIDDTTDHAAPRITNSDVVTVRYEDGTMEQVAAKDLNLLSVGSANDIVEQRLQPFQQYAQAMQTFRAGQEVTMDDDGSGNTYTSHVVSVSTDGVEVEIENAQGEPDTTIIPNEIALTALHPVEQKHPEQQVEKQEPFEFVKTDPFGNPIVVEQPEQIPTTPQKIVPNIDTMLADELGASVVEYLGDKASAIAYLEAERDKADDDVKRLAKQKVTRYTDIADFKRQNDELQAAKKAAADRYNKLQNAIATANNYKTKVEQAAEAERKAREEERRATRRQTQTAQLANAAPAERWKAAPKVEGNAVTRTLSDGTIIKGHYILVEAGAATPSHDPFNGWNTSNGFPVTDDGKNINDRDYKNDTDAQQITTQIAQTYDGQAVAQVPVVSSEGIVYDGNGRTIAGNIAAANNTDGAYIQALADNAGNFGFAPEQVAGMQHPRVYMQTDEDLPYNTTTFAKFNAQEKKSQGSTNRAVSSSKKLTDAARDGMLRILDDYGTLDAFFASENGAKDIVRSLLDNGIITQQEVAGLTENTDRGFVLSPAGKDYVTDLLIGGLFDEQTIRMLGNDKGLKQSILRAMPSIVENRRLGDYALTDNINNAIRLLYEARQAGMAYPLYVKQGNAFDGYVSDRFSPFEMLLAEEMSSGVETFRQVLNLYNNSARDEANGQTGLFEPRTFDDIKKEILQHYGKSTDQSAATTAESTQSRPANTQTEPPVPSTPTGDGQERDATDIPASNILEQIEAEAEPFEEIELTPANWYALFGEDGIVSTPIGNVKMGENQYLKLAQKGRDGKLGMIKPTLEHPSVVVMDKSQAKDGQNTEREFSYVFVKAFVGKNGERLYYFTSITVSKDGQEVVISNQEKERSRIQRLLKNGKLAYINKATLPPASDKTIQGDQLTNPVGEELSSADKGTKNIPNSQTPEQKSAENLPNASQDEQSHTEETPKDEQPKDNGGKEQSQSQQSNTPKTFAQERTDVDLRTLRGAIQIQEIEDLPKDIAPNSLIEVAADDDFGTIVRIGFKNKDLYVQTESKDADGKQWRHTFIVPNARQHVIANIADKFYGNQVSDFTDEEREALKDALYKADTIEHLNGMRQGNIAYQKASAHITDETTDTEIHAITELTEAPERQFAQWVDTLNAGNIRRVAKALNENTSLEAMRALGIAKRAFSRKAREELGDIAKSYVGSTYKLSDVKRVAIAYAADNIYHSDNVPNKETIEAYVEKIYNEAKAARIAELEADLGKPLSLDDKKALIKQISDGKTKVVLVTNKTIVKKLAELGATRKTIADVAAAVSCGDKVKGFFAKGMVILNTDVLQTGNDIIATYVHERQHLLTAANPQLLFAITDNATADELAQILRTITGTAFYDQYNNGSTNGHTALADELVSHIMQEAYATGTDAAEVAKGYGITNETILQTLNNIDYEQRQSNSLSKARRDNILGRNSQSSSRQSGRNNQTQSQGGLVQQRSRPAGKGSSGTPSRGQTPERGQIADIPVSALSFVEQAKALKELISFQSKEEEQYFDSILPNLKADKLGVNAIPPEVILQENSVIERLEERVSDYIAEHYPTQGSVSALTNSPQGKKEREAMRKDSALAQLRKEVNAQQDAAQRKIDGKYEEVKAIVDNPSITLREVAQLWNDALEFCHSLDTENGIRFSVENAGSNLHKSLKSSTFAGEKSRVPKAELSAAYADMFRKQAQGQFPDGNGFAYSANYFHWFTNGRIVFSIPIEGNEDKITQLTKEYGTYRTSETPDTRAENIWRSQRPSHSNDAFSGRKRGRDERVDRLYGAERTDGASDNQKVNRDTQSDSQTELTDPRFSVSGTQVVPLGERTLVGLHNISSDKLRKVLKAGGLANPSAAVIDIAKQDHHGYGEISLVMPSSLVDSREGNNAGTYTGDMWSPTYPLVERRLTDKGADVYYKALNSAFGNDPARRGLMNKIALGFSNWLSNQHDPKDFAYWYMLEKGLTPEDVLYNSGVPASVKQRFEPIAGKRLYEYSEEDKALLLSLIAEQRGITAGELKQEAQELRQRYQETLDDPDSKVFQRRIAQDAIEDIDTYGVKYNVLEKGIDSIQNAIKYDGKIDIDATLSKAEEQVQADYKDDFDKWLNDFDERFDIKEYIFDGYTRDGDRKYIPNTLANASRLMNREELQNAGSHGGFNATKGQLIERMNTLADIRANKYRLTSKEGEKDEQWEQLSNEWFENIIDPLSKMQKISDNPFSNVDYAEQRLLEALRRKDPIAHLNKEYGYNIAKDSEFAKSLNDLVQRIKNLPAKYFETKFKRPVYLNEFRNAVVPNDLSQDLRDGLEKAGLGLYEYDPETEGSRREATLQATEDDGIRFFIIGERNTPEVQYDELDYDTDNLTDAQQLATDAVLGALDDAGISVERVSDEEAEREVEKEKSESSVRLIRQMAEGTKGQSNNPITSAKVQKNLEVTKEKYKKYGISTENAITDISKALGARNTGTSNYITIEAKNGTIFTLRLSNHNATVANFDNNGETNGISIVISRHNNKGITNNGDAHIVEFFYSDKSLNKADGTPIADIIGALEQTMYSGEYTDPTGLAQRQEVNIPAELQSAEFSIRQTPAPKNTGIGYKVFYRGKDGKLYPPMVANPNGADTPIGVWLNADAAPISGESKTGRPQVKAGGKGTQGGSGQLAYRPGWHLGEIPYALQFNRKDENGDRTPFPKDFVWAEVEYAADVNYQQEAEKEGVTENGKYRHSYAGLKHLPTDGYYRYRTNPNPETAPWIITGAMKVNRVLTNEEVDALVLQAGREPQQREFLRTSNGTIYGYAKDGKIYLTDRGLNPNTPIHEYTHLWVKAVRNNNAELYDNLRDLFSRKNLPDMWNELDNDPQYRDLSDEAKLSEIIARFSSKRGAERMEQEAQKRIDEAKQQGKRAVADAVSFRERMRNLLRRFWNWVGEHLFHIKHFGSSKEAADRILYDLLNGTDLGQTHTENDSQAEFSVQPAGESAEPQPRLTRGEVVTKILVQNAKNDYNTMQAALKKVSQDIKGIRAAMRLQSGYDRNVVSALLNLYNTLLQSNNVWAGYMPDTTQRVAAQIVNAIGKQDISKEVNTIMDYIVDAQTKAAQRQWDKLRQTPIDKINISGVVAQGKVALQGQYALKALNNALESKLTASQMEEMIGSAMANEENSTDESLRTQYKGKWIGYSIAQQHMERIGHLKQERQQLLDELDAKRADKSLKPAARQQVVDNIKEMLRDNNMEQANAYIQSARDLQDYIAEQGKRAKGFIEKQNANREKIRGYAAKDLAGVATNPNRLRTKRSVARSVWDAFASPIRDLQSMLRLCGMHAPDGEGYLYNHFMRNWIDGADRERLGIVEASKTLDNKIADLTHGKYKTWKEAARKINNASRNKFTVTMLNGVDKDGNPVNEDIPLNAGNALYIYAVNKMADGKMKLAAMNITDADVEKLTNAVREKFGQEIINVVDWIQSEYFSQLRNRYNPIHEDLFGAPMDAIENYFPLRINANARQKNEDLGEPDTEAARLLTGTSTGAIKRRTRNTLPLDVRNSDFFSEVIRHIAQMERWSAFAQWTRDANILFSDIDFRNRIKGMNGTIYGSGDQLYNHMKDAFRVAVGTYKPNTDAFSEFTLNAAKGVTSAKINFRLFTAIKQLASFPAFLTYMTDGVFVRSYMRNWLKPHETMKWAKETLPNFEKRVSKRDMGDMRLMQRSTDWQWNKRILEISSKYGMAANVYFDTLTCATGARAVYDSRYAEYKQKGYSEEEAANRARQDAEMAFNTSQQSSEGAFMAPIQLDRNLATAALTVFRTSNFQYTRNLFYNIRNLKNKLGQKEEMIASRKQQYIADGLTEEQAQRAAEHDWSRSNRSDIIGIVVYGALLNLLWRLFGNFPYLIFGNDNDKKAEIAKKSVTGGAFVSPVTGLLGGGIVEQALDGYGDVSDMFAPELPFTQDVKKAMSSLKNDRYAEFASQALSVLMQSGAGFDPQTAADMIARAVTTLNSEQDLENAEKALRVSQALLSIPQSQYEQMLIDEVLDSNLDQRDALADYQRYMAVHKAPLTWYMRSEESKDKIDKSAKTRFDRLIKERKELRN